MPPRQVIMARTDDPASPVRLGVCGRSARAMNSPRPSWLGSMSSGPIFPSPGRVREAAGDEAHRSRRAQQPGGDARRETQSVGPGLGHGPQGPTAGSPIAAKGTRRPRRSSRSLSRDSRKSRKGSMILECFAARWATRRVPRQRCDSRSERPEASRARTTLGGSYHCWKRNDAARCTDVTADVRRFKER